MTTTKVQININFEHKMLSNQNHWMCKTQQASVVLNKYNWTDGWIAVIIFLLDSSKSREKCPAIAEY